MHSFNIQDDQSTRFPSTTNYKNDNNIKRFLYREFTIRRDCSAVRSFCCYVVMQVRKDSINHPSAQPLMNFAKRQTCSASCQVFEWTLVGRGLRIILLLKHHIHLVHAAFWVLLHAMFMYDWPQRPAKW